MRRVDLLAPAGLHDAMHPSGAARYDREVAGALTADGWSVRIEEVAPDLALGDLRPRPGASVLLDGRLLDRPGGLLPGAVPVLHAPPADRGDLADLLSAAPAIVATSTVTRDRVLELVAGLHTPPMVVASPGVGPVRALDVLPAGHRLRCVGALVPQQGQDVLLTALGRIRDLAWRCELVGAPDVDPRYAHALRRRASALGIADRVVFSGPRRPDPITRIYEGCDLLVHPSRAEGYGMVIAEAVACGIPVLTTDVGGTRQALGGARGAAPGMLVHPGDPAMLADALRIWLSSRGLRLDLTATARDRSRRRRTWPAAARAIGQVLTDVPASGRRDRVST